MDNTFNVKDYFALNYGLSAPPRTFKLKGKAKIFYILIIPILLYIISKMRRSIWQKNYNIRHQTWSKELDKFYDSTVESMHLKERAMRKIGLDDSQIDGDDGSNVKPFFISSKIFKESAYRRGPDYIYRTDRRQITWLFFTKDQIYTYTMKFMLSGAAGNIEILAEFFYTDVTSVRILTEYEKLDASKEVGQNEGIKNGKKDENRAEEESAEPEEVATEYFKLVVPGDMIDYYFDTTEEVSRSIKGMRQLIRDKKLEYANAELKSLNEIKEMLIKQKQA